MDAALRSAGGTLPPGGACRDSPPAATKLFAPVETGHRVHRDLRRPAASAGGRVGRRQARLGDLRRTNGCEIDRWQRILALASAAGRRDVAQAVVTIGRRDDGSLRRRGPPSAARDRAGRARGLRVAAVDRNADAPGLASADVAEVVDFTDVERSSRWRGRIGVDGVLTVSADRAVPVVAAVAEELGLPGIGTQTAHLLTHKRAMRDTLARGGFRSPRTPPSAPVATSRLRSQRLPFRRC